MRKGSLLPYLVIALLVIILDQASKYLIIKFLVEGESVSIAGDLLYFQFIFNEGGAMGTSIGPSWLYTILTLLALVLIGRYFLKGDNDHKLLKIALAMVSGGAVGNLIDRIRFGKVIDFIDLDFPDIPFLNLYRWFTFNVADSAITCGLIILVLGILLRKRKEPPSDRAAEPAT